MNPESDNQRVATSPSSPSAIDKHAGGRLNPTSNARSLNDADLETTALKTQISEEQPGTEGRESLCEATLPPPEAPNDYENKAVSESGPTTLHQSHSVQNPFPRELDESQWPTHTPQDAPSHPSLEHAGKATPEETDSLTSQHPPGNDAMVMNTDDVFSQYLAGFDTQSEKGIPESNPLSQPFAPISQVSQPTREANASDGISFSQPWCPDATSTQQRDTTSSESRGGENGTESCPPPQESVVTSPTSADEDVTQIPETQPLSQPFGSPPREDDPDAGMPESSPLSQPFPLVTGESLEPVVELGSTAPPPVSAVSEKSGNFEDTEDEDEADVAKRLGEFFSKPFPQLESRTEKYPLSEFITLIWKRFDSYKVDETPLNPTVAQVEQGADVSEEVVEMVMSSEDEIGDNDEDEFSSCHGEVKRKENMTKDELRENLLKKISDQAREARSMGPENRKRFDSKFNLHLDERRRYDSDHGDEEMIDRDTSGGESGYSSDEAEEYYDIEEAALAGMDDNGTDEGQILASDHLQGGLENLPPISEQSLIANAGQLLADYSTDAVEPKLGKEDELQGSAADTPLRMQTRQSSEVRDTPEHPGGFPTWRAPNEVPNAGAMLTPNGLADILVDREDSDEESLARLLDRFNAPSPPPHAVRGNRSHLGDSSAGPQARGGDGADPVGEHPFRVSPKPSPLRHSLETKQHLPPGRREIMSGGLSEAGAGSPEPSLPPQTEHQSPGTMADDSSSKLLAGVRDGGGEAMMPPEAPNRSPGTTAEGGLSRIFGGAAEKGPLVAVTSERPTLVEDTPDASGVDSLGEALSSSSRVTGHVRDQQFTPYIPHDIRKDDEEEEPSGEPVQKSRNALDLLRDKPPTAKEPQRLDVIEIEAEEGEASDEEAVPYVARPEDDAESDDQDDLDLPDFITHRAPETTEHDGEIRRLHLDRDMAQDRALGKRIWRDIKVNKRFGRQDELFHGGDDDDDENPEVDVRDLITMEQRQRKRRRAERLAEAERLVLGKTNGGAGFASVAGDGASIDDAEDELDSDDPGARGNLNDPNSHNRGFHMSHITEEEALVLRMVTNLDDPTRKSSRRVLQQQRKKRRLLQY